MAGSQEIEFHGQVWSVKTRVDGGIIVAFDLPENEVMQAAQMMEVKRAGALLTVRCEVSDIVPGSLKVKKDKLESGEHSSRKSERATE